MTTFEEYKAKVSIAQVSAPEIRGLWDFTVIPGTPRTDANGNKEQIVIRNPNDNANQHYFDRNYKGGDVINFIKEHLNEFAQFTGNSTNDYVKINMVLNHFS